MAKKNELIRANAVDAEVLNGEILGPAGDEQEQEDFSGEAKHIADTERKFTNLCEKISAHSKEGRRLMAIGAASAVVMVTITGDVKYIDQFLASVGEDSRRNAFRRYFEVVGPVVWDANREVPKEDGTMKKQAGFVLHKAKQSKAARARSTDKAKYDTGLMIKSPWQVAGREPEYKALSFPELLQRAVKQAKRQKDPAYIKRTKATAEDVKENDFALLDKVEALLAQHAAEGKNTHQGNEARQ
jgi:hypothetical protein